MKLLNKFREIFLFYFYFFQIIFNLFLTIILFLFHLFSIYRNCQDPLKCKKAARASEKELENEWNKEKWQNGHKDYIMRRGLMFKFSQHKKMLDRLMLSGNKRLVEESYKDPYWGGMLENSKNKLGDFLAELRDNYRNTGKIHLANCGLEPIEM